MLLKVEGFAVVRRRFHQALVGRMGSQKGSHWDTLRFVEDAIPERAVEDRPLGDDRPELVPVDHPRGAGVAVAGEVGYQLVRHA